MSSRCDAPRPSHIAHLRRIATDLLHDATDGRVSDVGQVVDRYRLTRKIGGGLDRGVLGNNDGSEVRTASGRVAIGDVLEVEALVLGHHDGDVVAEGEVIAAGNTPRPRGPPPWGRPKGDVQALSSEEAPLLAEPDRRRVNDRNDPDVDFGEAGFAAGRRTRAARGAARAQSNNGDRRQPDRHRRLDRSLHASLHCAGDPGCGGLLVRDANECSPDGTRTEGTRQGNSDDIRRDGPGAPPRRLNESLPFPVASVSPYRRHNCSPPCVTDRAGCLRALSPTRPLRWASWD